ncbi:MAG: RsmD family RNA methyltransferase [Bacteroidales bacterium]
MRIVSGKFKGRIIRVHKGFSARPTTDFAKESLFNFLNNYFDFSNTFVLDLFSGTGSISYEFASRGCPLVDLVESNVKSLNFIRKTIAEYNITEINPFPGDAFQYIKKCRNTYDLVFADPPYQHPHIDMLPDLVMENSLLKPKGWFVLEHSDKHDFAAHAFFRMHRHYGSVNFSIFCEK